VRFSFRCNLIDEAATIDQRGPNEIVPVEILAARNEIRNRFRVFFFSSTALQSLGVMELHGISIGASHIYRPRRRIILPARGPLRIIHFPPEVMIKIGEELYERRSPAPPGKEKYSRPPAPCPPGFVDVALVNMIFRYPIQAALFREVHLRTWEQANEWLKSEFHERNPNATKSLTMDIEIPTLERISAILPTQVRALIKRCGPNLRELRLFGEDHDEPPRLDLVALSKLPVGEYYRLNELIRSQI